MNESKNVIALFNAGKLDQAIEAATGMVRSTPGNGAYRRLLAELLCVNGELERADQQLEAMVRLDATFAVSGALLRQLIRAEQARIQFHKQGRLPEFLDNQGMPDDLKGLLEVSVMLRERSESGGSTANQAVERLETLVGARTDTRGTCDGQQFNDLRDLDDLTCSFFEVFTSTGKYYWVPFSRVSLLEFHEPASVLDQIWRQAHMVVNNGPGGEVFLPSIYTDIAEDVTDEPQELNLLRLGRMTAWHDQHGVIRGRGHRMLLVADQEIPFMQIKRLEFDPVAQRISQGAQE